MTTYASVIVPHLSAEVERLRAENEEQVHVVSELRELLHRARAGLDKDHELRDARSEIVEQARELRALQLERDRIAAHEAVLQARLAVTRATVHAERLRWKDALSTALGADVRTPEQARDRIANLVKIREAVSDLRTLSTLT